MFDWLKTWYVSRRVAKVCKDTEHYTLVSRCLVDHFPNLDRYTCAMAQSRLSMVPSMRLFKRVEIRRLAESDAYELYQWKLLAMMSRMMTSHGDSDDGIWDRVERMKSSPARQYATVVAAELVPTRKFTPEEQTRIMIDLNTVCYYTNWSYLVSSNAIVRLP
jgi:hypothetical protein